MDKRWWQILVLDLSLFTFIFICASWSSVAAWSHNLSSNLVSSDLEFWPLHHFHFQAFCIALLIWPLRWSKSPRHIVASTTLVLVTWVSYTHHSTPYPSPVCIMNPRWAHTHATLLHQHRHTFDALTSFTGVFWSTNATDNYLCYGVKRRKDKNNCVQGAQ